jgi:hypothetical protein
VPLRASTGLLSVSTGDGQKSSSSSNFTIIPPTVTSFTPTSGIVGSAVTITGTGFSTDASIDTIRFNGTWSKVTKATSTTLTVNVPIGAKKGAITVSVGGGETVSSASSNASQIFCVNPPQPTIKVSGLSSQPTLTSSASSGNQWFLNGVAIPEETNQTFAPKTDGVYSVQATVDGCQGVMSLNEVIVITGDINTKAEPAVTLYPNPIENFASVNLENLISGEPVDIQFFNILGDKLMELSSQGGITLNMDIGYFSSGTYFVRIIQGGNYYSCKFVKP